MKRILPYYFFFLPFALSAQKVASIKIDGSINPVIADYVHESIDKAHQEKATCLLIYINTPGGLLQSTRIIVSDILESPVPIIVYVSPGGAHAGSAGVFITTAAHIAVMAPGTNIGAAHPVSLGKAPDSIMNEKGLNDAVAFIRTIAEKRNRNMQWAEDAVRKSISSTEKEALEKKVIDLIAVNERDLLNQVDGKQVNLNETTITLHTKGAQVVKYEMSFVENILNIISDPSISYIIMLLGMYGILFELYNPGAILPGIVGVISLILAFYSMHYLPINYAGLALIIFSIILFLLEIKIISHGILAIGGVSSLLLGSMMLIKSNSSLEFVQISQTVIISSTIMTTLFFLFVIGMGLRAQKRKVAIGIEAMAGTIAEVLNTLDPTGTVRLQGEVWNAESVAGKINTGERVLVKEMRNLKLYVEKAHD
ncbi:Nodulation efficiency protein NfeD [Chitinophaga sp. CF118]|uniref:NfeD family protein n=1 Tax=Chitinophaga sp. CF118 TaxID=1884367 RepID=UPI0008EC20DC|nr:nodulation protein NfeD [Chitinophaga sp. CF118]SFD99235.1 Nodulation efficiency protein NfeD [Chitinophaga sp. CF118]